jgi:hypothetical protein
VADLLSHSEVFFHSAKSLEILVLGQVMIAFSLILCKTTVLPICSPSVLLLLL